MRTIKFRGKRIDNINHERKEFVYGSFLYLNTYEYDWNGDRSRNKKEVYFIVGEDDINIIVDKETIGQFTGLHDKNGKEIYEGDILQDEFCVYKVVFEDGCFVGIVEKLLKPCGTQKGLCYTLNDILNLISDDTEIIGNIYENPELLERSSNGD